jgi:hypothetical protein
MTGGGVPERSNGAVLKTASALTGARGFESHPRRSNVRDSLIERISDVLTLAIRANAFAAAEHSL